MQIGDGKISLSSVFFVFTMANIQIFEKLHSSHNVLFSSMALLAHKIKKKISFHYNVESHIDLLVPLLHNENNTALRYLNMPSIIPGSIFHLFELRSPLFLFKSYQPFDLLNFTQFLVYSQGKVKDEGKR